MCNYTMFGFNEWNVTPSTRPQIGMFAKCANETECWPKICTDKLNKLDIQRTLSKLQCKNYKIEFLAVYVLCIKCINNP